MIGEFEQALALSSDPDRAIIADVIVKNIDRAVLADLKKIAVMMTLIDIPDRRFKDVLKDIEETDSPDQIR